MRRLRLLLDTNVLVDAQVRDLLLRMAEAELIDVRWSQEILVELRRTLVERMEKDPVKVDRLIAALDRAFPEASVAVGTDVIERFALPDPDDRHVLAAATEAGCDWLVTDNVRDFPDDACAGVDVDLLDSDDAVARLLALFPRAAIDLVEEQVARLKRPSTTVESFVRRLAQRRPHAGIALGEAFGIPEYARLALEIEAARSGSSPQTAILGLLDAIHDEDDDAVIAAIGNQLAQRLIGPGAGPADRLRLRLRHDLADVWAEDGWGFPTQQRGVGDVEIVTLARPVATDVGSEVWVAPFRFVLTLYEGRWLLTALDILPTDRSVTP